MDPRDGGGERKVLVDGTSRPADVGEAEALDLAGALGGRPIEVAPRIEVGAPLDQPERHRRAWEDLAEVQVAPGLPGSRERVHVTSEVRRGGARRAGPRQQ